MNTSNSQENQSRARRGRDREQESPAPGALPRNSGFGPEDTGKSSRNGGHERGGPELKPWMARVFAASGVEVPGDGSERQRLAWLGAEMARFLWFCRELPEETPVGRALEAYGKSLKEGEGKYPDWRLDQAREALRILRNGIEEWRIAEGERGREVRFRVRDARPEEHRQEEAEMLP